MPIAESGRNTGHLMKGPALGIQNRARISANATSQITKVRQMILTRFPDLVTNVILDAEKETKMRFIDLVSIAIADRQIVEKHGHEGQRPEPDQKLIRTSQTIITRRWESNRQAVFMFNLEIY